MIERKDCTAMCGIPQTPEEVYRLRLRIKEQSVNLMASLSLAFSGRVNGEGRETSGKCPMRGVRRGSSEGWLPVSCAAISFPAPVGGPERVFRKMADGVFCPFSSSFNILVSDLCAVVSSVWLTFLRQLWSVLVMYEKTRKSRKSA